MHSLFLLLTSSCKSSKRQSNALLIYISALAAWTNDQYLNFLTDGVEVGWECGKPHHVGDHYQDDPAYTGLGRQTHLFEKIYLKRPSLGECS